MLIKNIINIMGFIDAFNEGSGNVMMVILGIIVFLLGGSMIVSDNTIIGFILGIIGLVMVAANIDDNFKRNIKFLIEYLNLEKRQKSDMIKILLIVGSILVAVQQEFLSTFFMIFIISSIIYYIIIQKDELKSWKGFDLVVLVIAVTFSTLVNINLFNSLLSNFSPSMGSFLYLLYYLIMTLTLWSALAIR